MEEEAKPKKRARQTKQLPQESIPKKKVKPNEN